MSKNKKYLEYGSTDFDMKGAVLTPEIIEEASKKILEDFGRIKEIPVIVSPKAYKPLQKIRKIEPDFNPCVEALIYWKAYELGIKHE